MIILHYVTAIKIKFILVIIVTWHFVPFSRDRNLELRIVVYGFLAFCEWFCFDVSQFGAHYLKNNLDTSLFRDKLPQIWTECFINAICDGNSLHDELCAGTRLSIIASYQKQELTITNSLVAVSCMFG